MTSGDGGIARGLDGGLGSLLHFRFNHFRFHDFWFNNIRLGLLLRRGLVLLLHRKFLRLLRGDLLVLLMMLVLLLLLRGAL